MKKEEILKKMKSPKALALGITTLIGVPIMIYIIIISSYGIQFDESKLNVQYGDEFTYESIIDSVNPKDAKITFPDVEVKEVGVYDLTFTFKANGQTKEENKIIRVVDSTAPQFVLRLEEEEAIKMQVGTTLDPWITFTEIKNMPQDPNIKKPNFELVDQKEFDNRIESIEKAHDEINTRVIDNSGKVKEIDTINNAYFYTTNVDSQIEGEYTIQYCVVDENYNYTVLEKEIMIVPLNTYTNVGGRVVCDYGSSIAGNEAVTTQYSEIYFYNEFQHVTGVQIDVKLTLDNAYDTTENMQLLYNSTIEEFEIYNTFAGVNAIIASHDGFVTTTITVDFATYDKIGDPLDIVHSETNDEIAVQSIIDLIVGGTCTIY